MNDSPQAGRLSAVIVETLDQPLATADLAQQAFHSRSHFFRVFRALLEETPAAMRRRLLLERAAWHLGHTRQSVTEIALDAGYNSIEAFTRAFKNAFRVSPSLYRRMGVIDTRLPAANLIHYFSSHEASKKGPSTSMDLYDLFAGAENWYTRRLLEHAGQLTAKQLDAPLNNPAKIFPWDTPDQSLRDILERMVYTKEVWTAALTGAPAAPELEKLPPEKRTPQALIARLEKAETEFERVMGDVRQRGAWNDTFVDALCEPAETFTFGGMFAHVITFNAYRRFAAIDALRTLGVKFEGFGCPSEYEATLAPKSR